MRCNEEQNTARKSFQREVKNIGLVCYLVMRAYEPAYGRRFRSIHHDLAGLQVYRFLHLLELTEAAYSVFQQLTGTLPQLGSAVKELATARRKSKEPEDEPENV